jgi:hypothetical protein
MEIIMSKPHTPAQVEAFRMGFADRMNGRPIMAFGDARDEDPELNDAYGTGYDPRNELNMVRPEYLEQVRADVVAYLSETGLTLPEVLPRNRCEFP